MYTNKSTWQEIEQGNPSIAVLSIGSTEQHGTGLPLCSDSLQAEKLCEYLAEELNAFLCPTIPVGNSNEHMSFRGTLTLKEETLGKVIADLVDSLVSTGFKKIIVISIHGGNHIVWSDFMKKLDDKYPEVKVIVPDLNDAWDRCMELAGIETEGKHADEFETSLMMHLAPDLVKNNPTDFPLEGENLPKEKLDSFGFPLDVRQISEYGSLGTPSKASREKGEKYWNVFTKETLKVVKARLS